MKMVAHVCKNQLQKKKEKFELVTYSNFFTTTRVCFLGLMHKNNRASIAATLGPRSENQKLQLKISFHVVVL